jgi:hypothetical protein
MRSLVAEQLRVRCFKRGCGYKLNHVAGLLFGERELNAAISVSPSLLDLTKSELISLLAAVVAILAALYARWSAVQTRRANEIQLHNERLKILRGLLDFRAEITAHGDQFNYSKLLELYNHVQLSEFYYRQDLYERLNRLFEHAREIDNLRRTLNHLGIIQRSSCEQQIQQRFESLEQDERTLEDDFRQFLRLVVRENFMRAWFRHRL